MSIFKDALRANERYVASFDQANLPIPPAKQLAIIACMDARLNIEPMLGLELGDAHIIRNAGGLVTDDALRSLIISHKLLGTRTFFVIEHTDCGMLTFKDENLQKRLTDETGLDASVIEFGAFTNLEENVRAQIDKITESPFLPNSAETFGFIYDVKTGRLNPVRQRQEV